MIIKRMWWATPEKSSVNLIADTSEGNNLQISTPYGVDSIIWEEVRAYPAASIEAYVTPIIEENTSGLNVQQMSSIIEALESQVPGIKDYITKNIV